jgi:hypothetical protein
MSARRTFLLAISAFFLAYVVFAVGVPPDEHDCTAHFFPNYVPARILDVFIWLVLAWVFWEYKGRRWLWSSFLLGGLAGGGFALLLFPIGWWSQGLTDVFHWTRVLGGTMTYAVISGLFAGGIPSVFRSLIIGFLVFVLQLAVDYAVQSPWMCIY